MQTAAEKPASRTPVWIWPVWAILALAIADRSILQHAFGQKDREASRIKHPPENYDGPSTIAWLDGRMIRGELLLVALQVARIGLAWLAWRVGGWYTSPIWLILVWRALVYRNALWDGAEWAFSRRRSPR